MIDSIISHGCFLRLQKCSVQRSILGDWSRLDYGVELQDMLMLGTYYYQAESRIASLLAEDVSRYASDDDNSSRNSFPCRTGLKKAQQSILDDLIKHGPRYTQPSVSGDKQAFFKTFFAWLKPGSSATDVGA
ncbi:hypothetical protein Rs2_52746 [Raphanus sativus]|nr:hypothetical protein Rs2_52746 [Raphanus sativus]